MSDCVKRIVEMSKGELSVAQAKEIMASLKQEPTNQLEMGIDIDDATVARAESIKKILKENAEIQKRNTLINVVKKGEVKQRVQSFMDEGLPFHESLRAAMLGTQDNIKNGRLSVAAKQNQLADKYIGGMIADLEAENLLPAFNSETIRSQIAQELWELPNGKTGISKSPEAQKIAAIVHKYQNDLRERTNRAGANIGEMKGYITRQSHDRYKVQKATFAAWKAKILPLLDIKKTFDGADVDKFLNEAWLDIVSGNYLKPDDDAHLAGLQGTANLAKKLSQRRVLHFKGADDWLKYNGEFGSNDIMESIIQGLDFGARNASLMESLGTNPKNMYQTIVAEMKSDLRGNEKKMKGYTDGKIESYLAQVDGSLNIADNVSMARVSGVMRGVKSMASLGGALISSLMDIPVAASEMQFQGKGWLESRALAWQGAFQGRGGKERKQLAGLLGVGFDGITGAIMSRFSAADDLPAGMTKLMRKFFKVNGQTWWADTMKVSVGMVMSNELASIRGKGWANIGDVHQQMLGLYGINEAEWNNIRKASSMDVEGREYLTPDAIQRIEGLDQREKDILETKLQSYYTDRVNHAVIQPDQRENAILNLGLKKGTVAGEAIRFMMQFKSFPISFASKVIGKNLYARGRRDIPMMLGLAAELTVYGYFAMTAKDLLKGREPRDPRDAATIAAAFVQGGGAGIYGDFLMGEYNRYGNSLVTTAAGPVAGTVSDLASIYAAVRNGDDAKAKALRTVIGNTPFANLFYVKPALDYLFVHQLQESMNKGYLRRMEKRVKQQNNQDFIIRPQDQNIWKR